MQIPQPDMCFAIQQRNKAEQQSRVQQKQPRIRICHGRSGEKPLCRNSQKMHQTNCERFSSKKKTVLSWSQTADMKCKLQSMTNKITMFLPVDQSNEVQWHDNRIWQTYMSTFPSSNSWPDSMEHSPEYIHSEISFQDLWQVLSRSLYRSHVLTTFVGSVLGAMMKQVCWHSSRSKAYRGLPEARGQSEAHGDSNLYTMQVRPCVTAKLPVLGPWFWNLILLNLAAASCYLHGGRFWRQQVPSPLWWRNLLQVLVRELNHFKQQRKALRQASQLCCFGVQMQFVTVFWCWLLALLRPSRRTRQTPAVAKSTPTAAKLGCAFSHSAERIVDELGLLYPENRGNLRKNMASV